MVKFKVRSLTRDWIDFVFVFMCFFLKNRVLYSLG